MSWPCDGSCHAERGYAIEHLQRGLHGQRRHRPYVYQLTGTLPDGMIFDATTATLSGTPSSASAPGSAPLTLRVTDAWGCVGLKGSALERAVPNDRADTRHLRRSDSR